MAEFVEPGVKFERIPNPKYAILPGGTAEVAFIGVGKQTLTQSSVSVVRGANWTAATVTSGLAAAVATSGTAYRFKINLNGDGLKDVDLMTTLTNGLDIASDIQAKVRAIVPTNGALAMAYSNFTCTFNSTNVTYTLTSGLPGNTDAIVSAHGVPTATGTIVLAAGTTNDVLDDLELDAAVPVAGTAPNDTLPSAPTGDVELRYGSYVYQKDIDYTIVSGNEVQWVLNHGPDYGITYFATYELAKVDSDYTLKSYYSLDEVIAAYGPNTNAANTISIAATVFYQNGGVKLNVVQMKPTGAGGTEYLMSDYTLALNSLELFDVDVIVPLLVQDNTFATLNSVTKEHVYRMSQPDEGKNRIAFIAPQMGTSIADYKAVATSMAIDRIAVVAPSSFIIDINNVLTASPAFYGAAALSGFLADPDNVVSEPLTRKELFGLQNVGTKYTKGQMRDMLKAGVLIIENAYDIIRVVHGITTDRSNLDTSEISLVRISDFFGKTLKNVLDKTFIGSRIDVTTLASIRGMIQMVVDNFITNGALIGSKQISVIQDTNNPTLINVSMILQPVYPLNYIDVKFVLEL